MTYSVTAKRSHLYYSLILSVL